MHMRLHMSYETLQFSKNENQRTVDFSQNLPAHFYRIILFTWSPAQYSEHARCRRGLKRSGPPHTGLRWDCCGDQHMNEANCWGILISILCDGISQAWCCRRRQAHPHLHIVGGAGCHWGGTESLCMEIPRVNCFWRLIPVRTWTSKSWREPGPVMSIPSSCIIEVQLVAPLKEISTIFFPQCLRHKRKSSMKTSDLRNSRHATLT